MLFAKFDERFEFKTYWMKGNIDAKRRLWPTSSKD
jgi:hypothetical protein